MEFKEVNKEFTTEMRENLLRCFRRKKGIVFYRMMRDGRNWYSVRQITEPIGENRQRGHMGI